MRWRNCVGLFFSILILINCSTSSEKLNPEVNRKKEMSVPKTHTVEIVQMQFRPSILTVHKGDTVIFVNKGMVSHDVTEKENITWTSGVIPVGASWKLIPAESIHYFCSIHVVMKGKVMVE